MREEGQDLDRGGGCGAYQESMDSRVSPIYLLASDLEEWEEEPEFCVLCSSRKSVQSHCTRESES